MFIAPYNAFGLADLILAVILGLLFGSFGGALVYRFKNELPFGWNKDKQAIRSICPPCGRTLTVFELIPIVSWIALRGRCACRRTRISWLYPLTEGTVCLLTLYVVSQNGWGIFTLSSMVLFPFLVAGAIVQVTRIFEKPAAVRSSLFLLKSCLYLLAILGAIFALLSI